MSSWYPRSLAQRIPWHANFTTQAAATGVARGLTVAQVSQIATDAGVVASMVNYLALVDAFSQAVTEFKDILLEGDATDPLPPVPTPPAAFVLVGGALAGIEERTRLYAGILRAAPGYTAEVGELYGLIAPDTAIPATPALAAFALTANQIRLAVTKAGYDVLAIDSRRGGGDWEQIGVSMTAEYSDNRPPLTPGQPEVREYRCQGMQNNARTGALSPVVSAATVP